MTETRPAARLPVPGAATRVAIVDDQEDFLTWARTQLDGAAGFHVVGHSLRAGDAVATVRENNAELLLVDFDMPGMNGIEVIRQVRQQAPGVRIVLMSLNDNRIFHSLARTAGAIGFIPKERFSAAEIQLLLDEDAV